MVHYSNIRKETSVIWALVSDGKQAFIFKYNKDEILISFPEVPSKSPSDEHRKHHVSFLLKSLRNKSADNHKYLYSQLSIHYGAATTVYKFPKLYNKSKEELAKQFIQSIAAKINKARDEKTFDYLVIVAPRDTLSALPAYLSDDVLCVLLPNMPAGYIYDKNGAQFAFRQEEQSEFTSKSTHIGRQGTDEKYAYGVASNNIYDSGF